MRNLLLVGIFISVSLFAESRQPKRMVRAPSNTGVVANSSTSRFRWGPSIGFDGLWGKAGDSEVLAKGLGYSLGVYGQMRFDRYRVSLSPSYQYLRMGKPFDGSGQLQEPSPANLDQSMKVIAVSVVGGYELERGADATSPSWWLDLGFQYLMPLSAEQTVAGNSTAFTAQKSFLLLLGPSMDLALTSAFDLVASLHGYYNLAGSSEGKFFGVRLLAGLGMKI